MPEKKEKKTDFEKKMWEAKDSLKETAGKVWEKSKEVAGEIWGRWKKSDTTEKVCKIWWIVLLIAWIFGLGRDVLWICCIVFWVLLVTWFFNSKK